MKELTFTVIILAILFTFGFCSTRASEIEPVKWAEPKIDWASLDTAIYGLEGCVYGEMEEIQFSLYFCNITDHLRGRNESNI